MFHDMFWGWHWFGGFFWIVVIVIVVILLSNRNRNNNIQIPHETSLDILKKRYAKGEITKEQFEQMKRDIQ